MDGKEPIPDMVVKGLFNENTTALVDPEDITLKELDQTDRMKLVRQLEQESILLKQNELRKEESEQQVPAALAEVETPKKEQPQTVKPVHDSSTNLEQLLEAVDDGPVTYEKQEMIQASPAPNFDADLQSASSSKLKLEEVQSSTSKQTQQTQFSTQTNPVHSSKQAPSQSQQALDELSLQHMTLQLEEIDQIDGLLEEFETEQFKLRKSLNKSDKLYQIAAITLEAVRLSNSNLVKGIRGEESVTRQIFNLFQRAGTSSKLCDELEQEFLDRVKGSMDEIGDQITSASEAQREVNANLSSFKGQFFKINEAFSGKDISQIQIGQLEDAHGRQEKIISNLEIVKAAVDTFSTEAEDLSVNFLTLLNDVFTEKFNDIDGKVQEYTQEKADFDSAYGAAEADLEKQMEFIRGQKGRTSDEKRKISEFIHSLQKLQRKHARLASEVEALNIIEVSTQKQTEVCLSVMEAKIYLMQANPETVKSVQLVEVAKQSKDFTDAFRSLVRQLETLRKMKVDIDQLLLELTSISKQITEFVAAISETLQNEVRDAIGSVRDKSQAIIDTTLAQEERIKGLEERIADIKISDTDHFHLAQEIQKCRAQLGQLKGTSEGHLADANETEGKLPELSEPDLLGCLTKFTQSSRQLDRLSEVDLKKVKKQIDTLESFVIKSLKNQLNDDNKRSQQLISRIKKNYEDLQKRYEALIHKQNEGVNLINTFNDRFDSYDLERVHEIQDLHEKLKEESQLISSSGTVQNGSIVSKESEVPSIAEDQTLQKRKRKITQQINTLVNQFNENNKLIKDSQGKAIKTEKAINELITRNKAIQDQCHHIDRNIEEAKQMTSAISDRLDEFISPEIVQEISNKYTVKDALITDCLGLKAKAEELSSKVANQCQKQLDQVDNIQSKLEMFNPLNYHGQDGKQDFLDQITQRLERVAEVREQVETIKYQLEDYKQKIDTHSAPIEELGTREVYQDPELEAAKAEFEKIIQDLQQFEQELQPLNADIGQLMKQNKDVFEQEIKNRLTEGEGLLTRLDDGIKDSGDRFRQNEKKHKYYKDRIQTAKKKYKNNEEMQCKLEEWELEEDLVDKDFSEIENKFKEIKSRKQEARKLLDGILKNPQKYTPVQIDNLLLNLDEHREKVETQEDKIQNASDMIDKKIKDLEDLLQSQNDKQSVKQQIDELNKEIEDDQANLSDLLEKLPGLVDQLKKVGTQMLQSSDAGDDYFEKKEDLEEKMEELDEIQEAVNRHKELFSKFKEGRDQIGRNLAKSQTLENLQKVQEQLLAAKNDLTNLFTDALDSQDQLQYMKKDLGDCDLPKVIAKRKKEHQLFQNRLERMKKEIKNLKSQTGQDDDPKIAKQLKELEFKLKISEQEKNDIQKLISVEMEGLSPVDFDDFERAPATLKKIKKVKDQIETSEGKLKDIEEVKNDLMKKLTEQDMEKSADLLVLRIQELGERLVESKKQLEKISKSGKEMDGNTSNGEEEEFIQAMQNEMPEVFDNIEATLGLLKQADKLGVEVKQTLDPNAMSELMEKVNIATDNVEESEVLVNKLEKEILEWNSQKKLIRRDVELEDAHQQFHDLLEDLTQEKQNTEIELDKNREKQEENRGQEMVDKDGNKVDIMEDLIKLEGQMEGYISEIVGLIESIKKVDGTREQIFEEFNSKIPKVVKDQRKKRQAESLAAKSKHLKRPAMLKQKTNTREAIPSLNEMDNSLNEKDNNYQMISVNCQFKKPIKQITTHAQDLNQKRKDLEERYSQMRKEVFKIKQIKLYKPVKGDVVDEMFAGYLNKAKLTIEVQRISASNYMFGTKKILAKIINNRLVIRVGGGFMNAEEFIEQYGKIEMMKMMKMEEQKNNPHHNEDTAYSSRNTGVNSRMSEQQHKKMQSMMLGADIKERMRQSLMKIKPYETHHTITDGTLESSMKKNAALYRTLKSEDKHKNNEEVNKELHEALQQIRSNISNNNVESPNVIKKAGTMKQGTPQINRSARSPRMEKSTMQMGSAKQMSRIGSGLGFQRRSTVNVNPLSKNHSPVARPSSKMANNNK